MDKILTRKMFKARYFKSLKPTIQHFQKGGLGSLSNQEKAIYAATLAGPLLQAKGSGVGNALSALGEGVSKLPATIIALEKNKAKKATRTLSEAEVKDLRLPVGSVVQEKSDGTINVVSKPSADQIKTMQGSKRVRAILSRISDDYIELEKPVGPISYRTISPFTKAAGTGYAKKFSEMKSRVKQATSFVTQAISGAAVSEQEAERIKGLIPQLGDTEVTFEAKLVALDSYFADAIKIAEDSNADFKTAIQIMADSGKGASNYLDLTNELSIKKDGDTIDVSAN
tara:strand:+ start:837 stop:1688 length:852 start_codon:yes stop_codon:yes gene_type:complete